MTTLEKISIIRLNINDTDSSNYDFTDNEILYFLNQKNSIAYASWQLCIRLIAKLRKQLLESDATGVENNSFASLRSRLELLKELSNNYENEYKNETNNSTSMYLSTKKPTIAGGDI